jgi:hypothetical protein
MLLLMLLKYFFDFFVFLLLLLLLLEAMLAFLCVYERCVIGVITHTHDHKERD